MTKPEWGQKRTCQECGAKFYDMRRPQIICPKCGTEFVATVTKPKRGKAEAKPEAPSKKPEPVETDVELVEDEELDDLEEVGDDDDEEEDEDLIEDASDLGDDDEDVAEVMEKIDGEKDV